MTPYRGDHNQGGDNERYCRGNGVAERPRLDSVLPLEAAVVRVVIHGLPSNDGLGNVVAGGYALSSAAAILSAA